MPQNRCVTASADPFNKMLNIFFSSERSNCNILYETSSFYSRLPRDVDVGVKKSCSTHPIHGVVVGLRGVDLAEEEPGLGAALLSRDVARNGESDGDEQLQEGGHQ
jgi:hypothetical protein